MNYKTAIVILNWNGANMMRHYLPSVIQHSEGDADVIVADNASTDDSIRMLQQDFPEVRIIRLSQNWGFAEGYNRALAQLSDYEYFMLLNSDVEIRQPHWLHPLIEYMDNHPQTAACQPKLLSLRSPEMFEYAGAAGGYLDRYGYPFCRGRIFGSVEKDEGQYDDVAPLLWATGAALFVRAADFNEAGRLDGRFFAHMEEIDLCWRLRIMGRQIVCIPQSTAYHLGGATLNQGNPHKTFLNFRNNLLMLYKNLPDNELKSVMRTRHLLDWIAAFSFLAKADFANFRAVRKACAEYKRIRPKFDADRQHIQQQRTDNAIPERTQTSILKQYYMKGIRKFSDMADLISTTKNVVLGLVLMFACQHSFAQTASISKLKVNEVMAANVDMFLDPSFNYGSWIELYNPTDNTITLGDFYISDDVENPKKYYVPKDFGTIRSNGFYTLWFDHHGIWNDGELRQISFKLDYDGGTILIADRNGKILLQQEYPQAISRTSYARTTDGGDTWGITAQPTPSASNSASSFASQQCDTPTFTWDGGLYTADEKRQVTIKSATGATLYVTTDGSVPTPDNPAAIKKYTQYTITLEEPTDYNQGIVIRARAYKNGMLPSEVVTRSYIYNYGYTLPIVSIAANYDDLYSVHHGIMGPTYVYKWDEETGDLDYEWCNGRPGNGQSSNKNWNMDWDRPVNFNYIGSNGEYILSQEVDMTMSGGWSRAYTPHSFKLKAAKYYMGKNTIDYPFFEKKPMLRHKSLQIRQGGNDNVSRVKDVILQQIVIRSGLKVDCQEWQPVHVFINGSYQGTLNMREPNNKHFAYSNYGIDTDNMEQFEMSPDSGYVQKEGDGSAFERLCQLSEDASDPEVYEEIKQLLDIDEYTNYMAVELYLCNRDWPQNNVKGFRCNDDGKFHFVLFDLDQAFDIGEASVFSTFAGKKTYTSGELMGYDALGNTLYGTRRTFDVKMATLFLNLLKNEEFCRRFVDTFCVVGGSVFTPSLVKETATDVRTIMLNARNAQTVKFGYDNNNQFNPTNSANAITSKLTSDRNNNLMTIMKNYTAFGLKSASMKSMVMSSNIDGAHLFINDVELPAGTFNGKIFLPVTFRAVAPPGYKFRGWTKDALKKEPDEYEYISTDAECEYPTSGVVGRMKAIFEPMTDIELAQSHIHPIMVNEVSSQNSIYVSDYFKKSDWFELYNTTDHDIDIAGMYLSDNIDKPQKYQIPTDNAALNTIIPAHGHTIVWADKRESLSSQLHADFKIDKDEGLVLITADPSVCSPTLFSAACPTLWTDSLAYTPMNGNESVGRYPDGSLATYLMNVPTPSRSNILGSYAQLIDDGTSVGIDAPQKDGSSSAGIDIVCVGNRTINVRSASSPLRSVQVISLSGQNLPVSPLWRQTRQFATIHCPTLPQGTYIIRATTADGKSACIKVLY